MFIPGFGYFRGLCPRSCDWRSCARCYLSYLFLYLMFSTYARLTLLMFLIFNIYRCFNPAPFIKYFFKYPDDLLTVFPRNNGVIKNKPQYFIVRKFIIRMIQDQICELVIMLELFKNTLSVCICQRSCIIQSG